MGTSIIHKILCLCLAAVFLVTSTVIGRAGELFLGDGAGTLPQPGAPIGLSTSFQPSVLAGMKVYPAQPFRFDFLMSEGEPSLKEEDFNAEAQKLIKYFLASLTVPEKELWVNLSPYEKGRIIPEEFGLTEMGRDLLAQDYILKQVSASLLSPDSDVGRDFWEKAYAEAARQFGTTEIPVDTFNKVWVVPEKAVVYEKTVPASTPGAEAVAYVIDAKLKVMLEADYEAMSHQKDMAESRDPARDLAQSKNAPGAGEGDVKTGKGGPASANELSSRIMRDVIIPVLEREVNEGRNFAKLRQVYHSLILATWYKQKIKDSLLSQVYVDRNKVTGVNIDDPAMAEKIWAQYVEAFKKGVVDTIREERDTLSDEVIPRKYFSGGFNLDAAQALQVVSDAAVLNGMDERGLKVVSAGVTASDPAQMSRRTFVGIAGAGSLAAAAGGIWMMLQKPVQPPKPAPLRQKAPVLPPEQPKPQPPPYQRNPLITKGVFSALERLRAWEGTRLSEQDLFKRMGMSAEQFDALIRSTFAVMNNFPKVVPGVSQWVSYSEQDITELVLGQMYKESSFGANLVEKKNGVARGRGLMQYDHPEEFRKDFNEVVSRREWLAVAMAITPEYFKGRAVDRQQVLTMMHDPRLHLIVAMYRMNVNMGTARGKLNQYNMQVNRGNIRNVFPVYEMYWSNNKDIKTLLLDLITLYWNVGSNRSDLFYNTVLSHMFMCDAFGVISRSELNKMDDFFKGAKQGDKFKRYLRQMYSVYGKIAYNPRANKSLLPGWFERGPLFGEALKNFLPASRLAKAGRIGFMKVWNDELKSFKAAPQAGGKSTSGRKTNATDRAMIADRFVDYLKDGTEYYFELSEGLQESAGTLPGSGTRRRVVLRDEAGNVLGVASYSFAFSQKTAYLDEFQSDNLTDANWLLPKIIDLLFAREGISSSNREPLILASPDLVNAQPALRELFGEEIDLGVKSHPEPEERTKILKAMRGGPARAYRNGASLRMGRVESLSGRSGDRAMTSQDLLLTPGISNFFQRGSSMKENFERFINMNDKLVERIRADVARMQTPELIAELSRLQREADRKGRFVFDLGEQIPLEQSFFYPTQGAKQDISQALQGFLFQTPDWWPNASLEGDEDTQFQIRAFFMAFRLISLLGTDPDVPLFPPEMSEDDSAYIKYLTGESVVEEMPENNPGHPVGVGSGMVKLLAYGSFSDFLSFSDMFSGLLGGASEERVWDAVSRYLDVIKALIDKSPEWRAAFASPATYFETHVQYNEPGDKDKINSLMGTLKALILASGRTDLKSDDQGITADQAMSAAPMRPELRTRLERLVLQEDVRRGLGDVLQYLGVENRESHVVSDGITTTPALPGAAVRAGALNTGSVVAQVPREYVEAMKRIDVPGLDIHAHPVLVQGAFVHAPPTPSDGDMEAWRTSGVPLAVIVWGAPQFGFYASVFDTAKLQELRYSEDWHKRGTEQNIMESLFFAGAVAFFQLSSTTGHISYRKVVPGAVTVVAREVGLVDAVYGLNDLSRSSERLREIELRRWQRWENESYEGVAALPADELGREMLFAHRLSSLLSDFEKGRDMWGSSWHATENLVYEIRRAMAELRGMLRRARELADGEERQNDVLQGDVKEAGARLARAEDSLAKGFGALVKDAAQSDLGGIDFDPSKFRLETRGDSGGEGVTFDIDPGMFQQLNAAPGFTPVIFSIQPLHSLPKFLGISQAEAEVPSPV